MIDKDNYKDLEKELWKQIEPTIGFGNDLDLFEILSRLGDEDFFNKIQHDDLALGLSGVDEEAMGRVCRRREYLQKLKNIEKENKRNKAESLRRWIKKTEQNTDDKLKEMLENK